MSETGPIIQKVTLETPFVLKSMASIEIEQPSRQEVPHRHDFYSILFVEKGQGIHHVDFRDYPLRENTFYLLSPEQVHHMELESAPKGVVLLFTVAFLQRYSVSLNYLSELDLFFNCDEAPPITIPAAELTNVKQVLQSIQKESQKDPGNLDIIGAYLKILLVHLKRIKQQQYIKNDQFDSRKASIVRAFKKDLETHFKKVHQVQEYAQLQNLSSAYLNEVIKGETGYSVKDFIQKRLILEAKRLALYSDWNMKEIAFELGFDDPAHFSKSFKKQEGKTFTSFRNGIAI